MSEESLEKNNNLKLTQDQYDFLAEVEGLKKSRSLINLRERLKILNNFEKEQTINGIDLKKYHLWYVIIGATPHEEYITEFDTPEEKIKNLILRLKK